MPASSVAIALALRKNRSLGKTFWFTAYGGIEQRWLLIESTDRKKADLKKLTQKISEEFLKTNKQLVKLEKEEFKQKSLAELKIKDMTAKLKYHQTSDIEITEKLNKGQTVV